MKENSCENYRDLLLLKVYNECEAKDLKVINFHIHDCEECKKLEQDYLAVIEYEDSLPKNEMSLPSVELKKNEGIHYKFLYRIAALVIFGLVTIFVIQNISINKTNLNMGNTAVNAVGIEIIEDVFDPFDKIEFPKAKNKSILKLRKKIKSEPLITSVKYRIKKLNHLNKKGDF
jgi:hypothetical protein